MPIIGISAALAPFRLVEVDDRAGLRGVAQCHDVGAVLGRPRDAVRPAGAIPQLGVGLLRRLHDDRHMVEIIELAVIGQLVFGQADADDVESLAEALHAGLEVDAVEPDLDRRDAAADAIEKSAAAHLVEHADLVDQPQRVVERQQIDHRSEFEPLRALRDRRQEDAGRRRIAERGVVVLGQVVAVKTGPVIGLNELQPFLEMPAERHPAVIQMVKNPKLHRCFLFPLRASAECRSPSRSAGPSLSPLAGRGQG
jgi:hypothetical protein